MGRVVAVMKILPKEIEAFDAMKEKVLSQIQTTKVEEVPIAFGLKSLNITVVVSDDEGGTEKIEETIRTIPEVGDLSIEGLARL
ncbi:MAG: elongation factor 1-beta [Candidatus Diapherotrites archaeon]|nr:elongation factor 1-beta [Candidatus Diapherotrites archaeon]